MRPSPSFRPDLEALDKRVLPALLSLSLPVSAFVAARVAPVDCAPALVAVDARVALNLNASLGTTCAPSTCAPNPYTPAPCGPGQLTATIGGLLNRVGGRVASDVNSIGCAVGGVVRQVATGIDYTVGAVDSIVTGLTVGCRPCVPARC